MVWLNDLDSFIQNVLIILIIDVVASSQMHSNQWRVPASDEFDDEQEREREETISAKKSTQCTFNWCNNNKCYIFVQNLKSILQKRNKKKNQK